MDADDVGVNAHPWPSVQPEAQRDLFSTASDTLALQSLVPSEVISTRTTTKHRICESFANQDL